MLGRQSDDNSFRNQLSNVSSWAQSSGNWHWSFILWDNWNQQKEVVRAPLHRSSPKPFRRSCLLDKDVSNSVPSLTHWWGLEADCEVELKFLTVSSPTTTYLSAPLLAPPPVPLFNPLLRFNFWQNHNFDCKSTYYFVTFHLDREDKISC